MRHRISNFTGLGNPDPVILDNNYSLKTCEFWEKFLEDSMNNFKVIKEYEGFDFHIEEHLFVYGIEPSYEGDELEIICFNFKDKNKCYLIKGKSYGPYGSKIKSESKFYKDFEKESEFIKFIDKWYEDLKIKIEEIVNER